MLACLNSIDKDDHNLAPNDFINGCNIAVENYFICPFSWMRCIPEYVLGRICAHWSCLVAEYPNFVKSSPATTLAHLGKTCKRGKPFSNKLNNKYLF